MMNPKKDEVEGGRQEENLDPAIERTHYIIYLTHYNIQYYGTFNKDLGK